MFTVRLQFLASSPRCEILRFNVAVTRPSECLWSHISVRMCCCLAVKRLERLWSHTCIHAKSQQCVPLIGWNSSVTLELSMPFMHQLCFCAYKHTYCLY